MIAYLRDPSTKRIHILDIKAGGIPLAARVERLTRNGQAPEVLATEDGGPREWMALVTRFEHLRAEDGTFKPGPDLLAHLEMIA